jgi:hypothetical protein
MKDMLKSLTILFILFAYLSVPYQSIGATTLFDSSRRLSADNKFYESLTQLLKTHVKQGRVDYKSLKQEKASLNQLVHQIAQYSLKDLPANSKKAFYINAYNLLVLHQIVENYPLRSVMDIPGFFDKQRFNVAGEQLTLNELEKEKLLREFQDPRIHFALVCGAKSCPPLLNEAYLPNLIEEQLQNQTIASLNSPQFIKVVEKTKQAEISEIFKWYEKDFIKVSPSIVNYINKYRSKPISKSFSIDFYTYDWQLNNI